MIDGAPHRLREERERLRLSQIEAAQAGGVSKNTQGAYEKGATPITLPYLELIEAAGFDVRYIVFGLRGSIAPEIVPRPDPLDEDTVEIAEIDLRFGLGAAFMDEEVMEGAIITRPFPRAWLRQITNSKADDLYWARGQGNSMEPLIGDGDIMLIDRSQQSLSFSDLVWAIAYGQTGMVKRLRAMADGSVKILSDNVNVPPEVAYDGELHIFGRVVAIVKSV